jgi:hypothetical protein
MVGSTSGRRGRKTRRAGIIDIDLGHARVGSPLGSKNDVFKCVPTDSASARRISTKLSVFLQSCLEIEKVGWKFRNRPENFRA